MSKEPRAMARKRTSVRADGGEKRTSVRMQVVHALGSASFLQIQPS
jgi:hypothetical protein